MNSRADEYRRHPRELFENFLLLALQFRDLIGEVDDLAFKLIGADFQRLDLVLGVGDRLFVCGARIVTVREFSLSTATC